VKLCLSEMVVAQAESKSIGPVRQVKFRLSHIYAKLSLASDKPIALALTELNPLPRCHTLHKDVGAPDWVPRTR
jgi:hypothetical protein